MNKIIYLDAAASSLKPKSVIDAQSDFLTNSYANAGRGICARANAVDNMVNLTRTRVAKFINAPTADNIIFTTGTTDGMNRISNILRNTESVWPKKTAVVMVSDLDHHSARMPFEEFKYRGVADLKVCSLDENLDIDIQKIDYADIFVITAMSNVLGSAQDVKKIIAAARAKNPKVITIVDAAQYVAHFPIDVTDWDCDFLCFSGHKIGADTGIGIMYIRDPENMCVDKFGGGMIQKISGDRWEFESAPAKFEAGTLPLTQIAGLTPAIDYLEANRPNPELIKYLYDELSQLSDVTIFTKPDSAVLSFFVEDMHCFDFGSLIGARGICLRVGNMCATWIHNVLEYNGSIRISVGPWNTMDEMIEVAEIIKKIVAEK